MPQIISSLLEDNPIAISTAPKFFTHCAQPLQLFPTLCDPLNCSPPGYSVSGFSRQEYWSGLPCPLPGDLSDPGIKPTSLAAPALRVDSLPLSPWLDSLPLSYQGSPLHPLEQYIIKLETFPFPFLRSKWADQRLQSSKSRRVPLLGLLWDFVQ